MKYDALFAELLALRPYEALGRDYFRQYGKQLDFAQFLLTHEHPQNFYPVEKILTPEAVQQTKALLKRFRQRSPAGYLRENDFIPENRAMEMEQMLRFIDTPAHKHAFTECVFVLNGTCGHQVGENTYLLEEGACAVIPAGVEHHQSPSSDSVCLTVKIRGAAFDEMKIPGMPYFIYPVHFQCGDDEFVRYALLSIYGQQAEAGSYSDQIMAQMFQTMMTYIVQKYRDSMQHLTPQRTDALIVEIVNYIYENYQNITLYALAGHFQLNHCYLSNLIHRECKKPFSVLLKEYRLQKAAHLLRETQLPLNDVCAEIGYKNVSQFIRNFKEQYGTTPLQYRKRDSVQGG